MASDSPETFLFRTSLGGRVVALDPWKLDRVLCRELAGQSLAEALTEVRGADVLAADLAAERLLGAARVAFDLPPVADDGSGHTEATVRRVLAEYVSFLSALKKNTGTRRTSSAPTAPAC